MEAAVPHIDRRTYESVTSRTCRNTPSLRGPPGDRVRHVHERHLVRPHDQLVALGVRPGGVLIVHSSYRAIRPVEGGRRGVIDALIGHGARGTIVMPSWPGDDDRPFEPSAASSPDLGVIADTFWRRPARFEPTTRSRSQRRVPMPSITCDPLPIPPHRLESPVGRVWELDGRSCSSASATTPTPRFISPRCSAARRIACRSTSRTWSMVARCASSTGRTTIAASFSPSPTGGFESAGYSEKGPSQWTGATGAFAGRRRCRRRAGAPRSGDLSSPARQRMRRM